MEQNKSIIIDNITYYPINNKIYNNCYDAFDICQNLKPNQYAIYYDKYIYKLNDNSCKATYRNDLSNNWFI